MTDDVPDEVLMRRLQEQHASISAAINKVLTDAADNEYLAAAAEMAVAQVVCDFCFRTCGQDVEWPDNARDFRRLTATYYETAIPAVKLTMGVLAQAFKMLAGNPDAWGKDPKPDMDDYDWSDHFTGEEGQ